MKLYRVQVSIISTGTRIEGYTEKTYFFTDWIKAAKFAHKQAIIVSHENIEYDEDGSYSKPSIDYPSMWNEYEIEINQVVIDENKEISEDGYIYYHCESK